MPFQHGNSEVYQCLTRNLVTINLQYVKILHESQINMSIYKPNPQTSSSIIPRWSGFKCSVSQGHWFFKHPPINWILHHFGGFLCDVFNLSSLSPASSLKTQNPDVRYECQCTPKYTPETIVLLVFTNTQNIRSTYKNISIILDLQGSISRCYSFLWLLVMYKRLYLILQQ